ncbi:MAG: YHS domain-containing protein [Desulfomonile tiedjei]|nr:YHS domain-containing protein [Desulfomonile tiedjei]
MKLLKTVVHVALSAFLIAAVAETCALAKKDPINKDVQGRAIKGYDPVAYFIQGKPTSGTKEFEFKWDGAVWQFSSAENLNLFKADPEKYVPQYGGYCAWAVAEGYTADIDPNAWTVSQGKLYLNYNLDIRTKWQKDMAPNIERANKNWPGVLEKAK